MRLSGRTAAAGRAGARHAAIRSDRGGGRAGNPRGYRVGLRRRGERGASRGAIGGWWIRPEWRLKRGQAHAAIMSDRGGGRARGKARAIGGWWIRPGGDSARASPRGYRQMVDSAGVATQAGKRTRLSADGGFGFLVGRDLVFVRRQADVVEPVGEAVAAEIVDFKRDS